LKEEFYISLIGEAFDGYTEVVFEERPVYVKHVSIRDQRYLHKYHEKYKQLALSKGLQTEEEKLKYVIKEGIWREEDDLEINVLNSETENLKRTVRVVFLKSERDSINEQIIENREKIASLQQKRKEVVGQTADDYAEARSGDEILRFLLFKNKELTEHLYSEEEFGELETWQVIGLTKIHQEIQNRMTDSIIQEAVLRPFFSMYLSLCENVNGFYGKPVTELTVHQLRVVLYGRMFFNIFQHTEDIPEDIKENPEKLLTYSENQRNKNTSAIKDDAAGSAVFGATNEDVKDLGGVAGGVSLSEEAKKHGGTLNMEQMMRLAGHDV
jgi:hypothetical protein|tara:strand:+ start:4889 stop:5866 length:978 start_codon:yes stop_codon:yes gene_type:complete